MLGWSQDESSVNCSLDLGVFGLLARTQRHFTVFCGRMEQGNEAHLQISCWKATVSRTSNKCGVLSWCSSYIGGDVFDCLFKFQRESIYIYIYIDLHVTWSHETRSNTSWCAFKCRWDCAKSVLIWDVLDCLSCQRASGTRRQTNEATLLFFHVLYGSLFFSSFTLLYYVRGLTTSLCKSSIDWTLARRTVNEFYLRRQVSPVSLIKKEWYSKTHLGPWAGWGTLSGRPSQSLGISAPALSQESIQELQ